LSVGKRYSLNPPYGDCSVVNEVISLFSAWKVVRSIGESFRSNPWLVLAVRVWLTFWWLRRVSSEVRAFLLLASPFSGCGGGVVWLGDYVSSNQR